MTSVKRRAAPHTVTAWQFGRHTGAVRGPAGVIHPAITELGVPWMWDSKRRAYLVNIKRLDEVLVAIELAGHHVQLELAPW